MPEQHHTEQQTPLAAVSDPSGFGLRVLARLVARSHVASLKTEGPQARNTERAP